MALCIGSMALAHSGAGLYCMICKCVGINMLV